MLIERTGTRIASLLVATVATLVAGCPAPVQSGRTLEEFDVMYTIPIEGITLKISNQTNTLLDPQIYVAPASGGVENLFTLDHKRTDFGFGGIGVVLPNSEVSLAVPCGQNALIGTLGGVYGDDLSQPVAGGVQAVLEEGVNVRCGALVEFIFTADDPNAVLTTGFAVTP